MLLFRLIGLLTLLEWSAAVMNTDICNLVTYSCGDVPPPLPSSFIIKGSKVDKITKNFVWFEEYYDPDNLRGKYVTISAGSETHSIFDYYNKQVVTYMRDHPGATAEKNSLSSVSCVAVEMDQSPFTKELGQKFGYYDPLMPRMYNAYETLRYGGPYPFANNGSSPEDPDRGVPCAFFNGCVFDENYDATYAMNFTWTTSLLFTPYGQDFPLRITEQGGYYSMGMPKVAGEPPETVWTPVQTVKSISNFEASPYMDHEIFQPPMRMVCLNQRKKDPYPRPPMPLAFSTSMEIVSVIETWEGGKPNTTVFQNELWYDSDLRLVRLDHLPSEAEQLILLLESFDKVTMLTAVHDFNTGLSFFADKVQGICIYQPILIASDIFFLSDKSTEGNAIMASPTEILGIDSTLSYKGRYQVRDIDCKGYSGQVKKDVAQGAPVPMLREVYVSADGWHEDLEGEENSEMPVTDITVFTLVKDDKEIEAVEQTNYYGFQNRAPQASAYDITGCAQNMKRKSFELQIQATNPAVISEEIIKKHYSKFVNEAHLSLMYRANLGTPLRVQDLEVIFTDNQPIRLRFTLLEQFNVKGTVLNPRLGLPLDQAIEALKSDLSQLSFFTIITDTEQKEIEFDVVANSLQEVTIVKDGVDVKPSPAVSESTSPLGSFTDYVTTAATDRDSKGAALSTGYSKGAVAGLSISMVIIGLAVGAAMMFVYFKKFRQPRNMETANLCSQESTP